jgi:hypothetical protein
VPTRGSVAKCRFSSIGISGSTDYNVVRCATVINYHINEYVSICQALLKQFELSSKCLDIINSLTHVFINFIICSLLSIPRSFSVCSF